MEMFCVSLISCALIGVLVVLLRLYDETVSRPRRQRRALTRQGLAGPPPSFLVGNMLDIKNARDAASKAAVVAGPPLSHNCVAALFPFFAKWKEEYGDLYIFSMGNRQVLVVTEEKMVKEMTTCTSLDLGKPRYQAEELGPLLGQGIITSNGTYWADQRKIIAPQLYMDKVKGMIHLVQDSTASLMKSWNSRIENEGGWADIEIDPDMRSFSADVISKACFGSNYSKGHKIFSKFRALQEAASKKYFFVGIPGIRHLPTKNNREIGALEKEIKILILNLIEERKDAMFHEEDLLQSLLEGAKNIDMGQDAIDRFIVDNCKNIHQAGYETTSASAAWCLMLLAAHPEWQERIRAEALEICKLGEIPDAQMVNKMKLLSMAINETLRLYPPVTIISREALKDMKLKNIYVPKGVIIWSSVMILHTDPEIWGSDSYEFNPQRFANGIMGACKLPHLFMPFGVGPRVCLGQNLALLELKILISSILSTFSISISPKYLHSPAIHLVLEPRHGVRLLLKKL